MIKYKITPNLLEHCYHVEMSFSSSSDKARVFLPTWIPGSYMVRDFSRHLFAMQVLSNNAVLRQTHTNTFELSHIQGEVTLAYKIYANMTGIRTAILGIRRGYFNPSSVCMALSSNLDQPHQVEIVNLPTAWQVFAALAHQGNIYTARDYQELVDSPFELGEFQLLPFVVNDIPHQILLSGNFDIPLFDRDRLLADVTNICKYEIDMFGGAPFKHYTFILNLDENIYTGLEHVSSTLLASPYYSLPRVATRANDYEYRNKLLGLISHEYFHAWNVKTIKPSSFIDYDLEQSIPTELLWWFEGVTSYFDDVALVQAGVITHLEYMQLMLDNINTVYKHPGHNVQSLYQASIEAWVKYYQQDSYSKNIITSYYVKGAVLAFILDIELHKNGKTLTNLMRKLYEHVVNGNVIADNVDQFIQLLVKLSDNKISATWLSKLVMSCDNLLDIELLQSIGLNLQPLKAYKNDSKVVFNKTTAAEFTQNYYLGGEYTQLNNGTKITSVASDGLLAGAGIVAGDVILAINGVSSTKLELELELYSGSVELTIARLNSIHNVKLVLCRDQSVTLYNLMVENQDKLTAFLANR